jgi:hypothetical protein
VAKTSSPSTSTELKIYIDDNMLVHLVGMTYGGWRALTTRCGMERSEPAQLPDPRIPVTCVSCLVKTHLL